MTSTVYKQLSEPLPENSFLSGSIPHDAYGQCLVLERKEEWNEPSPESIMEDMPPRTVARVLGYALKLAPSIDCRDVLAHEIMGCKTEPASLDCSQELLAGLAHLYVYAMMRVFYNPKAPTPSISAVQSPRHSFEDAATAERHRIQSPLVTTRELRDRALFRDGYRCVFTGEMDLRAWKLGAVADGPVTATSPTTTAHIISQPLSSGIHGLTPAARAKFDWASTVAAVLERFGGFSVYDILGDGNLNSPANAFTATPGSHILFDELILWLVPAENTHGNPIPHTYDVRSISPLLTGKFKSRLTFKSATLDGTIIPPPHPQLLAVHATCAQVAYLSGALEHLEDIFGDPDMAGFSVMNQPKALTTLTQKLKALQFMSPAA